MKLELNESVEEVTYTETPITELMISIDDYNKLLEFRNAYNNLEESYLRLNKLYKSKNETLQLTLNALEKVVEYDSSFVDQPKGKSEMRMVAVNTLKKIGNND